MVRAYVATRRTEIRIEAGRGPLNIHARRRGRSGTAKSTAF
jgi:hypothetical protein